MDINAVRREFNTNIDQIFLFINTLMEIESGNIVGIPPNAFKVMKSSVFLQIYNILESNVHKIILLIHKTINNDKLNFGNLTGHMQRVWFRHLQQIIKSGDPHVTFLLIQDNYKNINFIDFDRNIYEAHGVKIPGNIDKRAMLKLCENMGVDLDAAKVSDKLKDIKDKRNELAHGNISFNDLGRNLVPKDLESFLKHAQASFLHVFDRVDDFCTKKQYKVDSC